MCKNHCFLGVLSCLSSLPFIFSRCFLLFLFSLSYFPSCFSFLHPFSSSTFVPFFVFSLTVFVVFLIVFFVCSPFSSPFTCFFFSSRIHLLSRYLIVAFCFLYFHFLAYFIVLRIAFRPVSFCVFHFCLLPVLLFCFSSFSSSYYFYLPSF